MQAFPERVLCGFSKLCRPYRRRVVEVHFQKFQLTLPEFFRLRKQRVLPQEFVHPRKPIYRKFLSASTIIATLFGPVAKPALVKDQHIQGAIHDSGIAKVLVALPGAHLGIGPDVQEQGARQGPPSPPTVPAETFFAVA